MGKDNCCGGGCDCEDDSKKDHKHNSHSESNHSHENPFASLDEETQIQIQELQMLEQSFQQLLMQKNAFSAEVHDTDSIIKEVEKSSGEVSRLIGGQVLIKTTKEEVLKNMKERKKFLDSRMKSIDEKEVEYSKKIESLRDEILKKIQK
jgi:prefoldin beta subunit